MTRGPDPRFDRMIGALRALRNSGLTQVEDPRESVLHKVRRWQRLRTPKLTPRLQARHEYDPRWSGWFEDEKRRLEASLQDKVQRIEHIGSTAIPGLSSKNVLDLLVAVEESVSEMKVQKILSRLGYVAYGASPCDREARWFWRVESDRAFVLHACAASNPWISTAIRFREYLRRHPEDRRAYEDRKRELRRNGVEDPFEFALAKLKVFYDISERANLWAQGRGDD